jgi:hypothetical protein
MPPKRRSCRPNSNAGQESGAIGDAPQQSHADCSIYPFS